MINAAPFIVVSSLANADTAAAMQSPWRLRNLL
jgi:hypothetical protein